MRNGVSRHRVLLIKIVLATGMHSNGTGPASRQLQDKVGGVTPAGLFLWGKVYLAAVRRRDRSRCSSCQSVQHGAVQGIVGLKVSRKRSYHRLKTDPAGGGIVRFTDTFEYLRGAEINSPCSEGKVGIVNDRQSARQVFPSFVPIADSKRDPS